jgi:peptidoglycan/xylan/chitin deacetylase (PgdA/CDA1 family)
VDEPNEPHAPKGQCVLTLHRVVEAPERDHDLSWAAFAALLDAIDAVGASVSTSLADPERETGTVVLTFDDGTADHLRAAEELASRGSRGVFFVPVEPLGEASRLGPSDVRRLVERGQVIGSHTLGHSRLDELTAAELTREVVESKGRLESLAGRSVEYFAPPGGSSHPLLKQVLEEAGYSASRSMRWGFYRSRHDVLEIPCLPVTQYTWRKRWIEKALASWELPTTMSLAWQVKRRLPRGAATRIRGLVSG